MISWHDSCRWRGTPAEPKHHARAHLQRRGNLLSGNLSDHEDGARLKEILEDVADNLFNPDPYYQQGGDMVRVGGLSYTIEISNPPGRRISNLSLVPS